MKKRIDPHNRECPVCPCRLMDVLTTPGFYDYEKSKMVRPVQHNICPTCGHRIPIRVRFWGR